MPEPFRLPRFYPILDTAVLSGRECSVIVAAEALLAAGACILQYRHKSAWTQAEYDEAERIAAMCAETGALFVVNDRADYARLLGAALHIGQQDLPPVAARRVMGTQLIGFSTHNRPQLLRGAQEPVDYLSLGPMFPTTSKLRPDPVVGLEGLRELRPLATKPLVAIGGIRLEQARDVLEAGADSVAVISDLLPAACDLDTLRLRAEEWLKLTG
jgi:thiamine-phosphate pyrophosphorylase